MKPVIVAHQYAQGSNGNYTAIRVNHYTKIYPHGLENGQTAIKGNYFVQWGLHVDFQRNEIIGSGYNYHWFNTLVQVEEFFDSL